MSGRVADGAVEVIIFRKHTVGYIGAVWPEPSQDSFRTPAVGAFGIQLKIVRSHCARLQGFKAFQTHFAF
jgi:hypothetical protein